MQTVNLRTEVHTVNYKITRQPLAIIFQQGRDLLAPTLTKRLQLGGQSDSWLKVKCCEHLLLYNYYNYHIGVIRIRSLVKMHN